MKIFACLYLTAAEPPWLPRSFHRKKFCFLVLSVTVINYLLVPRYYLVSRYLDSGGGTGGTTLNSNTAIIRHRQHRIS